MWASRGKEPQARSRHDYYNLRDCALADKTAEIEQLAARYSYFME